MTGTLGMAPHEARVVEEKADLDHRITLLKGFVSSPTFLTVDQVQADLLMLQLPLMEQLSDILGQRIKAFWQWERA